MLMSLPKKIILLTALSLALASCSTTKNSSHDTGASEESVQAADANIQLGLGYLQKNNIPMAKQKLLSALRVAPSYPASWYSMAYYYEATDNMQRANEYFLQALSLAPNAGDTNNNYGTFLCQTGQPKAAISRFLIAAQDPNYVDTAAAYENAGLCALRIPDVKLAKTYFEKSLQQDPTRAESINYLAAIYYKNKDYKTAFTMLSQFLQSNTPTPSLLLLAAQTAKQLNLTSDMYTYRNLLLQRFPNSPEAKIARTL